MEQVSIPPGVYTGSSRQLFDFLATSMAAFIAKHRAGMLPGTSAAAAALSLPAARAARPVAAPEAEHLPASSPPPPPPLQPPPPGG